MKFIFIQASPGILCLKQFLAAVCTFADSQGDVFMWPEVLSVY